MRDVEQVKYIRAFCRDKDYSQGTFNIVFELIFKIVLKFIQYKRYNLRYLFDNYNDATIDILANIFEPNENGEFHELMRIYNNIDADKLSDEVFLNRFGYCIVRQAGQYIQELFIIINPAWARWRRKKIKEEDRFDEFIQKRKDRYYDKIETIHKLDTDIEARLIYKEFFTLYKRELTAYFQKYKRLDTEFIERRYGYIKLFSQQVYDIIFSKTLACSAKYFSEYFGFQLNKAKINNRLKREFDYVNQKQKRILRGLYRDYFLK